MQIDVVSVHVGGIRVGLSLSYADPPSPIHDLLKLPSVTYVPAWVLIRNSGTVQFTPGGEESEPTQAKVVRSGLFKGNTSDVADQRLDVIMQIDYPEKVTIDKADFERQMGDVADKIIHALSELRKLGWHHLHVFGKAVVFLGEIAQLSSGHPLDDETSAILIDVLSLVVRKETAKVAGSIFGNVK